jgi:endonuclease G
MRILATMLCAVSLSASAAPTSCPSLFIGGQAPDFLNDALTARTHVLCYEFYSTAESGVTRTALWSGEHLTRESVAQARALPRVDSFHADESIAPGDRAERADYFGSGLDEGHMSPNGDMPDVQAQFESFSLANMVPQSPDNNRHLWEGIEIATRGMARYDGEVYVVTGPAFVGPRSAVGGRVQVPTHVWKAIYDPRRGAAAYITLNRPGNAYAVISIAELARITGVDPFPAVALWVKERPISLPAPRPNGQRLDVGPVAESALGLGAAEVVSSVSGQVVAGQREYGAQFGRLADSGIGHYLAQSLYKALH